MAKKDIINRTKEFISDQAKKEIAHFQEYWNPRSKESYNKDVQEGIEQYKYGKEGSLNIDKIKENAKYAADNDRLINYVIAEEGFEKRPTNIGDGKITLGSGLTEPKWHNLYRQKGNTWSKEDNKNAVSIELADRNNWAEKNIPNWDILPERSKHALLSYKYNYDFNKRNSPKLYKALKNEDWETAAKEINATSKDEKFKKGLEERRKREQQLFLSGFLEEPKVNDNTDNIFYKAKQTFGNSAVKVFDSREGKKVYNNGGYLYAKGGWMPSKETQVRIATWEGSSMHSPAPDTHKVNNSFEKEARGFRSVIPKETWDVLSEGEKNALYSLSYNIGCGAFKQRVVPTLNKYAKGKATAADVAACMYGTKDNDPELPGLPKRRAIERNLFGAAAYARTGDTSYLRGDAGTPVSENGYVNTPWGKVGLDSPMSEDFSSDSDMFDLASPNPTESVTGGSSDNIQIKTGVTEQDPEEAQQTNARQSGMQAVNDLYERLNTTATMPQAANPNQGMQQAEYEGNQMYNNALQSSLALNNQFLNSSSNIGLLDLVGEMDARDRVWAAEDQVLESNE